MKTLNKINRFRKDAINHIPTKVKPKTQSTCFPPYQGGLRGVQNNRKLKIENRKSNPLSIVNCKLSIGFTLVELIVVIVILAILATIAFLSFSSYSSSARDSTRISDINSIVKSLELVNMKTGSFPTPSNAFSITYSG